MISTRDALTSSSSDSAVRWLRSRLGDPTAEDLAAAADSLENDTLVHLEASGSASLSPLLERWPEVLGEPALLDTVLDVAVEWFVRERGMTRDAAVGRLRDANPALSSQLDLCQVLTDAIGASCATATEEQEELITLPAQIGPSTPSIGKRYELRQVLGRGSQGRVFLAVDRALSDPDRPAWVAVKLARVSSPVAAQKLIDEATKSRRIEHQNVVRALDADLSGSHHTYLVTEYVEGGTLERLRCGSADEAAVNAAVKALVDVCRGVQAIHAHGLVHCDLKPTNVLLARDGTPKVADFGLSVRRWRASGDSDLSIGGGNLAFMSPEQFRHPERPPSPSGDIYALGGLLLWVLTGRSPNGATASEVAARLTKGDPTGLEADLANIADTDLRAITRRALAPSPADRYASADALGADLERWLGHERLPWMRVSAARRARLFVRREPMLAGVAGVAALVVLVTGVAGGVLVSKAEGRSARAQVDVATAQLETDNAKWQARLDAIEKKAAQAQNVGIARGMETVIKLFADQKKEIREEWLPMLTCLEVLAGPTVLGEGSQGSLFWTQRILFGSELFEKLETRWGGMTMESAMWRACVAYWKIRAHDAVGGRDLARGTLRMWDERGWATDEPLYKKLALIETLGDFAVGGDGVNTEELRTRIRTLTGELAGEYKEDPLTQYSLRRIVPPPAVVPAAPVGSSSR